MIYRNKIEATNRLIQELASRRANLRFLDIYDRMLNPDRSPNTELFLDDKLHMSQAGYAIWKEVVEKYLSEVCQQTVSSGRKQRLPKLSGDPYEWYSN